ncbi:MAG TPA: fused MFS/spermidine synthase [Mycobacteriales bacterium]|nr:fused MFS/spermidine synthase [Mycobacteriales bacterium]
MRVELLRDAERPAGWWLMVGASEQSFVDIDDPAHLEFEYVQLMSYVIETAFTEDVPLASLHLGGGLCTVPRWIAERYPGSPQRVAEASEEIAGLALSLDPQPKFDLVVTDAMDALAATAPGSLDLLVSDVYTGPDTVMSVYPLPALEAAHAALQDEGLYVCNISDATPFALAKTVVATLRAVFSDVVLLVEPAILRGRRSGNLVLAASDLALDRVELSREAAGGIVRARVMADGELDAFVGATGAAYVESQLPPSGESNVRSLR